MPEPHAPNQPPLTHAPEPTWTGFDWAYGLRVLRRRRWPALGMFALICGLVAVYVFTRVPMYEARARLILDRDRANATGLSDPMATEGPPDSEFQTQVSMLQGRSLVRRTLQALDATPNGPARGPAAAAAAEPIALTNARDTAARGESALASARIDAFLARLRVVPLERSRLIDLSYSDASPVEAARVINAHAEQFIQQHLSTRFLASKEVTDWVSDRLAEQRKAVDESERALAAYRETHNVTNLRENATMDVQQVTELTAAYAKAKAHRIEQGALAGQLQVLKSDADGLDSVPAVLSNPFIQGLRTEVAGLEREQAEAAESLGPKHPTLLKATDALQHAKARLQAELVKVSDAVQRQYAAARVTEASLAQVLDAQKRAARPLARTDVELAVLEREALSNREIYSSLLQRVNEFSVTREQPGGHVRLVDRAEPPRAALGVNVVRDLRNGLLGACVLALCFAFLLEHLDNTVKGPADILELHPALIGMLPTLDMKDGATPLVGRAAPPRFSEAVRSLRTGLQLSIPASESHTILVTSPSVGDGKSLVASNLAAALAIGAYRVLLIDADLRRPQMHTLFDLPQTPGLTTLLVETMLETTVPRPTALQRLHVLPCGPLPPNPSELLDSVRFKQLLEGFRQRYDWIVVDSPPVMAVTDATILASMLYGVIVVAAAGITPLPLLRGSLRHLHRAHARILGVVLNHADISSTSNDYAEYYGHDHERYYDESSVTS